MCDAPFYSPSSNYPVNVYPYGLLFVFNNSDSSIQQIYIPHQKDQNFNNSFAYRSKWDNTQDFSAWIYLSEYDYTSILLNRTGYIAFRNGLIIQYGIVNSYGPQIEDGIEQNIFKRMVQLLISYSDITHYQTFASFYLKGYNAWAQSCPNSENEIIISFNKQAETNIGWFTIGYY